MKKILLFVGYWNLNIQYRAIINLTSHKFFLYQEPTTDGLLVTSLITGLITGSKRTRKRITTKLPLHLNLGAN